MFHYFYFNDMLPFEVVQQAYLDIPEADLKQFYDNWQESIERRLNIFYSAQWAAHQKSDDEDRDEHFKLYTQWQKLFQFLADNRARLVTRRETLKEIIDQITGIIPDHSIFNVYYDELWFNYLVDKYPRNVELHRTIPYKQYLQSPYWKYVRALMLMLHGARCQGDDEMSYDSYWFGWENELEVHHLTYDNRGAERYRDLTLLCERCHAKVHQEEPA